MKSKGHANPDVYKKCQELKINYKLLNIKYLGKKHHAISKKIEFELSLKEYFTLLLKAKIQPENIGIKKGYYQLARLGDKGPYSIKNCRFISREDNRKEQTINGKNKYNGVNGYTKDTHLSILQSSKKRSKGTYITPFGNFYSLLDAEKETGIPLNTIKNRCVTNNCKKIPKNSISLCNLPYDYLGKTWKEVGYGFKSKNF